MMLCCFKSQAAILLLNSLEKTLPTSQKDPEPSPPHLTPLACPSPRPDAQNVSYGKNFFQVKHFQSQPHFL